MKNMLIYFSMLFFLISITDARPQQDNDSLVSILKSAKEDTARVGLLIEICKEKWKHAAYTEAKKYADEALILSEKLNFKNGIAEAYNQTGIVFWYLKEYEKASTFHYKALAIYKSTGKKEGISRVLNRLGHDHADMFNYLKAHDYFRQALELDEQMNNLNGVSVNLDLIGYVYMCLSDYSRALDYYFRAIQLAEQIGSKRGIAAISHDIGVIYEKQNNLTEALKYAKNGLLLASEIGERRLLDQAYTGLENIYLKMNDYKGAYHSRVKIDEIESEMKSADHAGKIKQMQMQNDFEKKKVSDSLHFAKEKEITAIKLQKQKAVNYGVLSAIAITLFLLFFVYRNFNKQRIANIKLKETQEQLVQSEKMAAFGVMASRVAHEIQNPLNFVNNFSEISQELLDEMVNAKEEDEKKEVTAVLKFNLMKIREHGKRAAAIVDQLQQHIDKGTAGEFFETR